MDAGMTNKRWQTLKRLFNEAIELRGAEREEFIDKACKGDKPLREELESLLKAHENPGVLDKSPGNFMKSVLSHHAVGDKKGEQVGPYKIIRLLEHGGMGSVYLARRTDGHFEQKVALKLLRTGFSTEEQTRRFLAERQILASLSHEHIARLYDGGVTAEGQPWFAMEYIEGLPIDEYCDKHNLTIRERLKLFTRICEAVQYAHRKLIVHRDLKPSNILVTKEGTVKLLDFGIAKALKQNEILPQTAPLTRPGQLPLTPAYASPEQVLGEAVTTGSDIYQLGVVLYELLCGCRPYEVSGKTPSEIERIVCEENPTRPSTAITKIAKSSGEILKEITSSRGTGLKRLKEKLSGDLDLIVLKALRKEPHRRYNSAEQLNTDIERYLEGRPVNAHTDSFSYRAGKFINRHKTGVTASLAILVLLVGYAVTITWYSHRTQAALEQAERETEKAEQVTDFLIGMFERANPYEAEISDPRYNENISTNELLDQGSRRVRQELSDQPEVQAEIMYNLGRIYLVLGNYDKAKPLLEDALALHREHSTPDDLDLSKNLYQLGRLLRHQGKMDRPARLYNESLEIQRQHFGEQHPDIAKNLHELAIIAARMGNLSRADSLFRKGLEMQKSVYGENHPEVATGLHLLGLLHAMKKEYPKAEKLLRHSLKIRENHVGDEHPMRIETLDRLGQILIYRGKVEEAEPMVQEAMDVRDKMFPKLHPSRAVSLNNMGRLLRQKENFVKAEKMFRDAEEIYRQLYGPENLDLANTLFERAKIYKLGGDYKQAMTLYKRALKMHKSLIGLDNKHSEKYINEFADLYDKMGKPGEVSEYRAMLNNNSDSH